MSGIRGDLATLLADLAADDPATFAAVLADNDAEGLRLLDLLGASEFDRLAFLARLRPDDPARCL
jgi:hypothetical protein